MDIYGFDDYRLLLKEYYKSLKSSGSQKISYRGLARKAGLQSSNFLYLVMQGKRNLSQATAGQLAQALGLSEREIGFFENLVRFNQALEPEEKIRAFRAMVSYQEFRDSRKIDSSLFAYYTNWYYPVIRELVNLEGFREDPEWIGARLSPSIPADNVVQAIKDLEEMGFLIRNGEGRLCQDVPHLTTDAEVASFAIRKFHKEMIEKGMLALKQPRQTREISSVTLSVSRETFEVLRERIREFQKDVQKLLSADTGSVDLVCQMNFQMFTLFDAKADTNKKEEPRAA